MNNQAKDLIVSQKNTIDSQEALIDKYDSLSTQQAQVIASLQKAVTAKDAKIAALTAELDATKQRFEALRANVSTLGFDADKIESCQDMWAKRGLTLLKLVMEEATYDASYSHELHDQFALPGPHDSITAIDNLKYAQMELEALAPFLKEKLKMTFSDAP